MRMFHVIEIVSGGQTGADRGGLDFAIEKGIMHSGYCPKGRRAEDGVIPKRYQLIETASSAYSQRTEKNVISSDGTIIFVGGEMGAGSRFTQRLCVKHAKPSVVVDPRQQDKAVISICYFLLFHDINTLNIAGSRSAEFQPLVLDTLRAVFSVAKALHRVYK